MRWKCAKSTIHDRPPSKLRLYIDVIKAKVTLARAVFFILMSVWIVSCIYHKNQMKLRVPIMLHEQGDEFSKTCDNLRLVMDQLVDDTVPSEALPSGLGRHERLNISGWVGANALMNECWTYEDRFRNYEIMPSRYSLHNKCNRVSRAAADISDRSRSVLVVRVSGSQNWTQDMILSIRALVAEVGWRQRMDVFILQHLEADIDSQNTSVSIPHEFEPYTLHLSMDDIMVEYEQSVIEPIANPPMNISVMAQYNHMAETYFMRMYPQYDFAWFVESDVRLIGRWDTFLNHVDLIMKRKVPRDKTVDLVSFTPSYKADRSWLWANSMMKFPLSELTMSLLQVHRVSRALIQEMHEHHLAGNNAYFEGFMPTVATMAGLNKFIYANPVFADSLPAVTGKPFTGIATVELEGKRLHSKNLYIGNLEEEVVQGKHVLYHGATYSPLNAFAGRYYKQWRLSKSQCRAVSLVHPVK